MSFYTNFWNLTNYIREGTLDLYLTKPVSGMFLVTFRYIDFATPIPAVTAGFIMLGIGWNRCGFDFNILNIGIFIGCLLIGTVLTYSIFLMPRLLGFWTMSTGGIAQISDSVWDFNNMPMKIYNKIIQDIGLPLISKFFKYPEAKLQLLRSKVNSKNTNNKLKRFPIYFNDIEPQHLLTYRY